MRRAPASFCTISLALSLILSSSTSFSQEGDTRSQSNASPQNTPDSPGQVKPVSDLPESPGSAQAASPQASQSTSSAAAPGQTPSGTAAAPAVPITGQVVSRPAGAAIAPRKQRQVRSFLIKFGLLAGAGVAIGTVAALALASPSRVPGTR